MPLNPNEELAIQCPLCGQAGLLRSKREANHPQGARRWLSFCGCRDITVLCEFRNLAPKDVLPKWEAETRRLFAARLNAGTCVLPDIARIFWLENAANRERTFQTRPSACFRDWLLEHQEQFSPVLRDRVMAQIAQQV